MQRNCMKCGHVNEASTGHELEGCPQCGAIYSRVEEAIANGQFRPAVPRPAVAPELVYPSTEPARATSPAVGQAPRRSESVDVHEFAESLRSQSLYPTFRSLVKLFYWIWMLLAVITGIGTLITLVMGTGVTRYGGTIGGIFMTIFFVLVARITAEVSLMMADLSDAAVRIAASQSTEK